MSGGASDFMQVLQTVAPAGSMVAKGQVVAEFDRQYQLLRLEDYQTEIDQAERGLNSLDANIEVQRNANQLAIRRARATVDKAKLDIQTIPVRSQIQAETLKLALEEAEANLKQLEQAIPYQEVSLTAQRRNSQLDVENQKREFQRAQANIDRMLVKASMDGMLVMQNMPRGSDFSQIRQGDQLFPGQMFAQIVDPSSMLVSATAMQSDIERLRVGAKATLRFDAYPGLELPAHVISIAAMTRTGGMRASYYKEIPVFLKIDRMDPRVIPDLNVSVDVVISEVGDTTTVPLEAVFDDGGGAKPYVFVKTDTGFEKREVELGLRNNIKSGVLSGLKPGEVVALEPPAPKPAAPARSASSPGQAGSGSKQES